MAERTTSYAKTVTFDNYKDHLLSVYGKTTQNFNEQAKALESQGKNHQGERENEQKDSGSSMVRKDAPRHDNRPPPEIAKAQDRQTFNEKWKEEQEKASTRADYSQHLLDRHESNNNQNKDRGQNYDYDYSR